MDGYGRRATDPRPNVVIRTLRRQHRRKFLFCNIFFSTSHVILLSLHHQSSCYSCIHIFDTLHLLVTVIHVGSPCVLTFAATNLSHGSTEPGNVNFRLFKVHVHHKYMGPKLFFGTPMNSNTPPPLYNPP